MAYLVKTVSKPSDRHLWRSDVVETARVQHFVAFLRALCVLRGKLRLTAEDTEDTES